MGMLIDLDLIKDELRQDEGVRHTPYQDSAGNWTIGVGHLMGYRPDAGLYWSDATIDSVLGEDIQIAYNRLPHVGAGPAFNACDTDPRRRALVNMSFNLGNRLAEFKNSLALIASKQWGAAADHLRESLWYDEVGERAERICKTLETGK